MSALEVIRDPERLAALAPEWRALWEGCPQATPFQSPEWLLPWQRHLAQGQIQVPAIRHKGSLVALLPLVFSPLPPRLSLMGAGVSDYLDLILSPDSPSETGDLVREWIGGQVQRGIAVDLDQLRFGSPLREGSLGGYVRREWVREPCPYLSFPPSSSGLPGLWQGNLGKDVAYLLRRWVRNGGSVETASESTLDETLTVLFDAHQRRWNRRQLPGAFVRSAVRAFHREAAAGMLARGMLRLYALRRDGEVVAALYCMAAHGRCYYYAAGFREDMARFSPGTLLISHAMEDAVARGDTEFDFLRGDEPYRYRWGAKDRFNHRVLHTSPGARGSLVAHGVNAEVALERGAKRLAAWWVRRRS